MKYWVYMNGEVPGSFLAEELATIPGFTDTSLVCPAEGGIENRNWRHAGEFPELAEVVASHRLAAQAAPQPPIIPAPLAPPAGDHAPLSPEDILNDTSSRIFNHVTDLMRELENRREERALNQSLQRQAAELKDELLAARERIRYLDERASLIPCFEERESRHNDLLSRARQEIQTLGVKLSEAEKDVARLRGELEDARGKGETLQTELQKNKTLNEELSTQLSAKELTLARAFAMIRRLEETLRNIVPDATAGISREVPHPVAPAEPVQEQVASVEEEVTATPVEEPPPPTSSGSPVVSWLNSLFPLKK